MHLSFEERAAALGYTTGPADAGMVRHSLAVGYPVPTVQLDGGFSTVAFPSRALAEQFITQMEGHQLIDRCLRARCDLDGDDLFES